MKSYGLSLIVALLVLGCGEPDSGPTVLTADVPLHLEEHLEQATVEASEVPTDLPLPVEWSFDEPQPDWKPQSPSNPLQNRRSSDLSRMRCESL